MRASSIAARRRLFSTSSSSTANLPPLLISTTHLSSWREANASAFLPPICNKLLHKSELSVMGVGGPNTRTDFHLEAGAEFFWQIQGDMELPIVERGKRKLIKIREGEVFLLPPRLPHSPQRTEGSFGLVIERERAPDELDGLRWYTDFEKCDEVLWERYFYCSDLGRDLVPVVEAFKASDECTTMRPGPNGGRVTNPPLEQDTITMVPPPFSLKAWLEEHEDDLSQGHHLNLFPDTIGSDLHVRVAGGHSHEASIALDHEVWLHQLVGDALVYQCTDTTVPDPRHPGGRLGLTVDGWREEPLLEGTSAIIPKGTAYSIERKAGCIGLVASRHDLVTSKETNRWRQKKQAGYRVK